MQNEEKHTIIKIISTQKSVLNVVLSELNQF